MPYASNSEVPSYVPKKKRSQWRAVWNSSYAQHKDESRAFAEANAVAGPSSHKVVGVGAVGFSIAALGPFKCSHCRFMKAGCCTNADVLETVELEDQLNDDGLLPVDEDDCCNEYEPVQESEKSAEDHMHEINKGENVDPGALHIFCPLVKVDVAKREVWGVVTAEVPDKENEVCDFSSTVPYYKALVDEMSKATDGVNIFPLREMHGLSAAGKGISIEFREGTKEVYMGFKVVDDAAWKKVEECVYTGFSQGGRYIKRWKDGEYTRYTAKPSEVSLVDVPCLTRAHFDYVKADGVVEKRAFKTVAAPIPTEVGVIPTSPTPIESVDPEHKTLVEERNPASVPSEEERDSHKVVKKKVINKQTLDRAGEHLTDALTTAINNRAFGQLGKGLYSVSCFAEIIEQLKYLWLSLEYEREVEGDESPATDDLKHIFELLLDAFLTYTEEQVEELSAHAAAFEGGLAMATQTADLEKAARKSLGHHFTKSAHHHEAVAGIHEKMHKAHTGAHEHHVEMGKAEGAHTEHHKAKAAFHKTMAAHHEALHKKHSSHAEHLHKMAASCAEEDSHKVLKLAGLEEGEIVETLKTTTELEVPVAPTPAPAEEFGKLASAQAETNALLKQLLEKLSTSATTTPKEPASENAGVEAAKRAAEILSSAAPIRSFPVPRTGDMTKAGGIEKDKVNPLFAHLLTVEHAE